MDPVALEPDVRLTPYAPGEGLPLFIEAEGPQLRRDPAAAARWVADHRPALDARLLEHGAIVLRGFAVPDTQAFAQLIESYPCAEMDYTAGATPRAAIAGRVYEATRTPPQNWIGVHQEMAYLPAYPARLAFYCRVPAETGGETVIADMRRFEAQMPKAIRASVEARGLRYVRNFRSPEVSSGHPLLDLAHKTWTSAFDTEDPAEAEAKARAMGLDPRWLPDGGLETSHVSRGFAEHPRTGETMWFNQMTTQFICRSNLGPRADLWMEYYAARGRPAPYTCTYGDGGDVPSEDREALYRLLDDLTVAFPWRHGDVMLVDNFLVGHGRNPYTGERDVQVALLA
jgi:alpha-ketoglutarate-dependent taurine dioxygenase